MSKKKKWNSFDVSHLGIGADQKCRQRKVKEKYILILDNQKHNL